MSIIDVRIQNARHRPLERHKLARDHKASAEMLTQLAEDELPLVRGAVAVNISSSPVLLEKLATDDNAYVRRRVAKNLNTSISILEKLAEDESAAVRWVVKGQVERRRDIHPWDKALLLGVIESLSSD